MQEDELAQANSEMRFLTLELMKIAVRRKAGFGDILNEFIGNVYALERTLKRRTLRRSRRKARKFVKALARQKFGQRPR